MNSRLVWASLDQTLLALAAIDSNETDVARARASAAQALAAVAGAETDVVRPGVRVGRGGSDAAAEWFAAIELLAQLERAPEIAAAEKAVFDAVVPQPHPAPERPERPEPGRRRRAMQQRAIERRDDR